jgi:DNA-binding MarR family transcriptional regulator
MASAARSGEELSERELAAWRGMLRTHRDVVARLDAELEREHGLPLTSYEVLIYLAGAPDGKLRMGELAAVLLLSRSGLTRLVDRLERQGLVARERSADDARGWNAVITERGRRKLATVRPAHLAGVRRHFLDRLSQDDLDALTRAWERVRAD